MGELPIWQGLEVPHKRKQPAEHAAHTILQNSALDDPIRAVLERTQGDIRPTLVEDFNTYWAQQGKRIQKEGYKLISKSPEQAFKKEVTFFHTVVENVEKTIEYQKGAPTVVLFDVDETIARVPETEGYVDIPQNVIDLPSDQRREIVKKLYLKDSYDRLIIRPGFKHVVNYLKDKHGSSVQFGILTTKAQAGLNEYLFPMLNDENMCPGAFSNELMMSSRDGTAFELVPDGKKWVDEETEQNQRISFNEALQKFLAKYPETKTLVHKRLINARSAYYRKGISDYDIKLFMLMRLLAMSRQEKIDATKEEDTTVPPGSAFVLFDDAIQRVALGEDQSMNYVHMPKFFLPDDLRW